MMKTMSALHIAFLVMLVISTNQRDAMLEAQPTVSIHQMLAVGTLTDPAAASRIGHLASDEAAATVRLHMGFAVDHWWTKADGRGVVFVLNCSTFERARAVLDRLPLARQGVMRFELIPMGQAGASCRTMGVGDESFDPL